MKTTQYAVKVKAFYNICIADIEQYFDFIKIVIGACLHSVLSRDGDESHMNSKRNLDVIKSDMNSKRKINVAKKLYIMDCKQALKTIFIKSKYCSISAMNMFLKCFHFNSILCCFHILLSILIPSDSFPFY